MPDFNNLRLKSSFLNMCRRLAPVMNLESAVNIFLRQLLVKFANTVQTLRNSQALDGTIKLTVVRLNTLVEFTALKF